MHFQEIFNPDSNIYQIFLSNKMDQLGKLSDWIYSLGDELRISAQTVFRIDELLRATVTDIIENAYDNNQTDSIKVELQYFNGKLVFQIEDHGVPFNPLESPEVQFPHKLAIAKIGGWAMYRIPEYSDEYNYQRKDNKNILNMVIYDLLKKNKRVKS